MRKNWKNNLIFLVLSLSLLTCRKQHRTEDVDLYTCPMHPAVVQHGPGTCPICGMDLVRKGPADGKISITENLSSVLKPANARVISSIKTVVPVKQNPETDFTIRGEVIHNAQTLGVVSATVSGRIEKLFVRSDFQPIAKGQRILELYSPELTVAQEEFLALAASDPSNTSMLEPAKEKLLLLGLSNTQIHALINTKTVSHTVTVYSPVTGYVATHNDSNSRATMDRNTPNIREGMYVMKGQPIFTVVSHRDLWAEFSVYPRDLAAIKLGDTAVVTVDNSYGIMTATVDRIQPSYDATQDLVKVRMRLINPHHQYHAGQHVTATFHRRYDGTLWIPKSAQTNLGINHVAFLKRDKTFTPVKISTGAQANDWIQIVGGLTQYDSIAYDANFLVDSEDFIKAN